MKKDGQLDEQRGPVGRGVAAAAGHCTLTLGCEVEAEWGGAGDVAPRAGVRVRCYLQSSAITCAIAVGPLFVID